MTKKYLYVIRTDVPPDLEEEFNEWYDKEHIPSLLSVPGFLSVRRYAAVEGDGPKFLTVFEIDGPEVLQTQAYQAISLKARNTDWSKKIFPHFTNRRRTIFEQIYPP